ncbi:Mitochondrial-processing peptidase subunit alpha [Lobosporangium transversale]|uniref:Alpha-MPP n=1 Tax=Lobosporangium transversale TaxID=64571 RepID=A0A1Y2GIQ2_9FUNG|nr:Metalloenzyme, LuxS/M16 peptidase-like protein [Lobosporangium transversale]KAF9918331.1 Mitochondrial-processing peptidase subunit alpha [Lobosporangium transversale]ORZ12124.1 Metalloenzyme, LuxS/M16 peptidase-like protein [Lobosporangium transversale]|eukprot:XP_021879989.1 Metalloenzyme, LuxS/M16 peptidase-like protein [Lobosporangium transversale]
MSKQLSSNILRHVLPFTRRANNLAKPLVSRMNKHQHASLQVDDYVKTPDHTLSKASTTAISPSDNSIRTSSSNLAAKVTRLSNGVRVATEDSQGHFASLGVYVDAGSRYEDDSTRGVSHILDRLAFKSTTNRTSEAMMADLETAGGNVMCSSSRESIMYQSALLPQDLPRMLAIMADTIRNPAIKEEELEEQKVSAGHEIHEYWSKPEMILPELLHTVAYKDNTLGNPLLCPMDSLETMTTDNIKGYIKTWYRPERIVVSAVGADHDKVVDLTEKLFGDMKAPALSGAGDQSASPLVESSRTKSGLFKSLFGAKTESSATIHTPDFNALSRQAAKYTGGTLLIEDETQPFTHLFVGFEGLSIHDEDIYALATLQLLMGGGSSFSAGGPGKGMYSRLFSNVLNHYNWIESCMSFNHCYSDSGLFGISGSCYPGYETMLLEVIVRELELTTRTGRGGIAQGELDRAKNQLRSSVLMNLESKMVQLEDLGRQVQVHGYKVPVEELCAKIERVTRQDMVRVARRIFGGQVGLTTGGSGEVTIVAQGLTKSLEGAEKVLEKYGLGKSAKW